MYGHLNNSIYAFLFDSIVNTYLIAHCGLDPFTARGSPSSDSAPENLPAVEKRSEQIGLVVSSYCDYFASVSFPDVLDLGLRVVKLGSSSVTYEIGVFRRGEEEVKVVGGYTHVFVQREGMRPTRTGMEKAIREGLEKLVVRPQREGKL
jgi:acyl-CoA thioester hydrolase